MFVARIAAYEHYGTWTSPFHGVTVYRSTSTIHDLLTNEHGNLYHVEVHSVRYKRRMSVQR